MIEIVITAATPEEAQAAMRMLAGGVVAAEPVVKGNAAMASFGVEVPADGGSNLNAVVEQALAAPKRGRGRPPKAAPAPVEPAPAAPAQQISASPENRVDPDDEDDVVNGEDEMNEGLDADEDDEIGDAGDDLIEGYAVTDAGLMAAMQACVNKIGLAEAQKNGKILLGGYAKRSEVVEAGPAAIATAIRKLAGIARTGVVA